jgi:NitT/TauT family transport system permease protein
MQPRFRAHPGHRGAACGLAFAQPVRHNARYDPTGLSMNQSALRIGVYRVLVLVGIVGVWWLLSGMVGRNLVPTPLATAEAGLKMLANGQLVEAVAESLTIYVGGLLIAVAIGIPAGLVLGAVPVLGRTLDVYVNALMATPRVAFVPLIIVFLGLGAPAKITIVVLGAVMPILVNAYAGVKSVDPELIEMARSTGASPSQVFLRIRLPGATPCIMVGLRLGATIGLINTIVAELYTAITGLGGLLALYGSTFQMAPYFVVVVVLAIVGIAITECVRLIEARLTRWREGT